MKVSVLTPTRNRPAKLARAIGCVLAQTHDDWEMVVYDVSDDPVKAVVPKDKRIRYHRGQARGPAADFQAALELATGDLVHPFSDDDELPPEALETAVRELGDAEWLVARTVLRDENGGPYCLRGGDEWSLNMTLSGEYMLGGAVYWRKRLSDKAGGFDPAFDGAADFDLYVRFARVAKPALIEDVLYLYNNHPDTDSNVRAGHQRAQSDRVRSLL